MKTTYFPAITLLVLALAFLCACGDTSVLPDENISTLTPTAAVSQLPTASAPPLTPTPTISVSPTISINLEAPRSLDSLLVFREKGDRLVAPDGTEYEFFAPSYVLNTAASLFTAENKIGYVEGDEPVYDYFDFWGGGWYVTGIHAFPNDVDYSIVLRGWSNREWPAYYRKVGAPPIELGPMAVDSFGIIFDDENVGVDIRISKYEFLYTDKDLLHEFFSDVLAQVTLWEIREQHPVLSVERYIKKVSGGWFTLSSENEVR